MARNAATALSTSAASPTIWMRSPSASELGAHAGAEQSVVVDEDEAHRHGRGLGTRSSTSVPGSGHRGEQRLAAEALDAPDDRLADASTVAGDVGRVEAAAGVADERHELGVVGLHEHVDALGIGVSRRVDDGLADGRDERSRRVVERLVADDDGLDADVVVCLDLHGEGVDRGVQRGRLTVVGRAVQPRPQLALLAAGDRRHPSRVGRALHQHQRLQHGVVQVGGQRRPLVLADARRTLVVEAPQQAAEHRRREDGESADDDGDGAGGRTDARQPAGAVGERRHAGAEQDDTDDDAHDADHRAADRRPSPDRRATTRSRCRARWPTAGTMIASPGHSPIARQATSTAAVAQPRASSRRHRSRSGSGRRCGPGRAVRRQRGGAHVDDDAEATGERQQPDRGADDRRLDPPTIGPATGNTGQEAIRTALDTEPVEHSTHDASLSRRRTPATIRGHPAQMAVPSGIDQGHPRWRVVGERPYRRRCGARPAAG